MNHNYYSGYPLETRKSEKKEPARLASLPKKTFAAIHLHHPGESGLELAMNENTRRMPRRFSSVGKTGAFPWRSCKMNSAELPNRPLLSKIIVAEKYPLSRASLADLLTSDGYRVFQSDNAHSAISCLSQNPDVSAVLADLDMPGWKSLVRRTVAVAPQAVIIAMVGARHFPDDPDLSGRGICACLTKPIVYADLSRTIRSRVGQQALPSH